MLCVFVVSVLDNEWQIRSDLITKPIDLKPYTIPTAHSPSKKSQFFSIIGSGGVLHDGSRLGSRSCLFIQQTR